MGSPVNEHYNRPDLLARIERALGEIGKDPETVSAADLAPVEEFHVGGRPATEAVIADLAPEKTDRLLDIGCGTGGTARFVASRYGCKVEGVDLTASFIDTGMVLNDWLGLTSKVHLSQARATELPFGDGDFDGAWMMHVGMNIEEKREVFCEVFRVLKPGAGFLIYDVMRGEDTESRLSFPLPWAGEAAISFVRTPGTYEEALESAGFAIAKTAPRHDLAGPFFDRIEAHAGKPAPPLSVAVIMGEDAPARAANLTACYRSGRIVPVEILARKPG